MNCQEMIPLLHAYVDGELDVMRSLDVEQHLKTCPACAAARRSLQSLRSTLRHSDLSYSAPASLRNRVLGEVSDRPRETRPRNATPWLWQWLAVGALGFAMVTLMLRPEGISNRDRLANEAISSHVRSLMVGHLTDVVSSDQHTVKPWFAGHADVSPPAVDFPQSDYRLVGGRVDYVDGHRAAVVVYRHGAHVINVFTWVAGRTTFPEFTTRNGYHMASWRVGNLQYCAVTDAGWDELQGLVRLLRDLGARDAR